MTTKPWPPKREPQTTTERREWTHTHPEAKLCDCRGSGAYQTDEGFHTCPHHAQPLTRPDGRLTLAGVHYMTGGPRG